LGERLLMATLLLGVGDFVGKLLALIITIVRTRSLSPAEFGGFGFIIQTIGMFAQIAGFSLGMAATRYVALYRQNQPEKARQISQFITIFGLVTTAGAALLMVFLAPGLAQNIPGLIEPMRWSALVLVTQTLSGHFLGLLAGLERFRAITGAVFLQNLVMLALTGWWAPAYGLYGTIAAMAASFLVTLGLALWQCRDLVGGRWATPKQLWSHSRILYEFCIPSLLGGLILLPANWLATAIIAGQHGPVEPLLAGMLLLPPCWLGVLGLAYHHSTGLRSVALFTAADQFRPMLTLLANLVAQPMLPLVTAQIRHAHDPGATEAERLSARHRAQRGIERSFQLAACLILPAHAFLAFAAPYVMALFGRTFAADWNVFLLVLVWGGLAGMSSLIGVALYAQGRIWLQNTFLSFYGVVLVVVTWAAQSSGEYALAWGHLAATLGTLLAGCLILLRERYLSPRGVLVQGLAMIWMVIVALTSSWIPGSARPAAIPLAVGITLACLSMLLRSEIGYVYQLLLKRLKWR
jgi:O-antigen/teichoic acid export membrane protein